MIVWIILAVVVYLGISRFLSKLKISNFAGKYVFVTGCDTGFGNKLTQRLDMLGFHVIAGCQTQKGCDDLKVKCSSRLHTIVLDVSSEEDIKKVVQDIRRNIIPEDKGLWAVVNNAGVGGSLGVVESLNRQDYIKTLNVNLFGVIDVTKACIPLIRKVNGRIVNIASMFGRISSSPAPYCISKYGVEAFSDCLRRELYHQSITVHILEPGFFKTNIINRENLVTGLQKAFENADEEFKDFYGKEYLPELLSMMDGVINRASSNIDEVIDAYEHAITAKYPKYRYLIGKDAQFLVRIVQNLPEWISDLLLSSQIPKPMGCRKKI